MGMYPSFANSYDILAVYRLESLSERVVRVYARCSFACDPSGGSILEHPSVGQICAVARPRT